MSTKHIIAVTVNVILALQIKFSTQLIHNQSDTYQWSVETNLLDFDDDDSSKQLMAFDPCLVHYCEKGMECIIAPSNMPKCVCQRECILYNKRKRRHVCGSNGKLYANFCELYRDGCLMGQKISISDMSECVRREPTCSADDYAIMKDNLLLYHHQNMVYLQHGPDAPVHRMDYLVSIIFSHYDQNNDGLVEKDELTLMWSLMDMHHVANDSNCTLLDMLTFDDMNGDHVLTINEFNDAFHRISETKPVESPIKQILPKIHLDMSLALNHLSVHVGDNMEIKCDITGASPVSLIWKRFGFDLSQIGNTTDDYDEDGSDTNEEIKLTADGSLYIQNVQMKHAGNYTCQASTSGMIVQTHIVNVHAQPVILISPQMQSKRPGESAEIVCYSVGDFVSSIEWLKNEKPLDEAVTGKFSILGNGTSLRINSLTFSDTGAYTCMSVGGHSSVSTLVIQADPTPIATSRDEKVFIFHANGISIYSSGLCQLVHEIHAGDFVPGTDDTICHQYARRCTWGEAVTIDAPDGLIYITQPMMDRILVLSIAQLIIIEVIPTDPTPMELHHIPLHDQLWIVSYNLHRDGTIKMDPTKSLQMLPDVRMIHVKHHPVHPEKINGEMMNFYVPPIYPHQEHVYDFKFGLVTHHKQRGFFKLDLSTMRYAHFVDLSIYDCVPEHIKFGGLYGFIIISCMEPLTHRQTGQLVLDYITNSIISIKADLVGVPFVSPDSRYVITINHRHDSVLLSVQQVTINGLVFAFDVETTLNISDIRFVKSSVSLDYDVYATTDKAEILFLSLDTGKVETITGVGEPGLSTWLNGGRKIKESDIFSNLIASPSKDAVFIINTKSRKVTCEIAQLSGPAEIVWA